MESNDELCVREDTVFYITAGMFNTVEVVAVDAAANESPPATITFDLR